MQDHNLIRSLVLKLISQTFTADPMYCSRQVFIINKIVI